MGTNAVPTAHIENLNRFLANMSNVIEGAIDIDFLEALTLTNDIELTIFELLTLT